MDFFFIHLQAREYIIACELRNCFFFYEGSLWVAYLPPFTDGAFMGLLSASPYSAPMLCPPCLASVPSSHVVPSVFRPQFGRLVALDTSEQFLSAVDQEHKDVTVIVHLYDEVSCIAGREMSLSLCPYDVSCMGYGWLGMSLSCHYDEVSWIVGQGCHCLYAPYDSVKFFLLS